MDVSTQDQSHIHDTWSYIWQELLLEPEEPFFKRRTNSVGFWMVMTEGRGMFCMAAHTTDEFGFNFAEG